MTKNPIVERKNIFFTRARVILEDELFLRLLKEKEYSYIVAISHAVLPVASSIKIKQKKTLLINLKKSAEDTLATFHDTARNEVRKTFSILGLEITRDDNRLEDMYRLYKDFRKVKHLETHGPGFLQAATRFNAYYKNELISVVTVYGVFPKLRIQNIFSLTTEDPELRKIIGYATRRLIYEVCAYGAAKNYESLDLASINLHSQAKAGITKFKMSFGGEVIDEYTYTYRSPFVRSLGFWKNIFRSRKIPMNSV